MTEEEAAEYFGSHSLADIWDQLEPVEEEFPIAPLAPTKRISLRLREDLVERPRNYSEAKGIPMRTIVWLWLKEKLDEEEERKAKAKRP